MNSLFRKTSYLLLAASVIFLVACSSSGGGSNNAEITADNMEALATAGTEGIKQAITSNNAPQFAQTNTSSTVENLTVAIAQSSYAGTKLAVVDASEETCENFASGGSAIYDGDSSSATITFTNCIFAATTLDGSLKLSSSTSGSTTTTTFEYIDFTVAFNGETETFDLKTTCVLTDSSISCTYESEALGIDGRTYSVSDISISGTPTSGITVSATITDPDHGIITITTTTPVTFVDCTNGQPNSGVIVVSDGTNTMTVTYIDCTSFSVNFNSSTTTYSW